MMTFDDTLDFHANIFNHLTRSRRSDQIFIVECKAKVKS